MLKYVLKRILSALVTIFFIITITFFLMKAIPGNPFAAEKMPNPEIEAAMMAKYGLDQPLWKQYIIYLGNFLRGDFGVSYTKAGLTVNKVIADGFPFSLTIGVYASLVVVFAGILFGSVCALRQNKLIDRFFMVLSTLGSTIPSFGLRRRMSRISFSSASVCWFGWLWGRRDWQTRNSALPSQRALQK